MESWYAEMRSRLDHLDAGSRALQTINSIESQVNRLSQAFWPSEIAVIESRARQLRPSSGRPAMLNPCGPLPARYRKQEYGGVVYSLETGCERTFDRHEQIFVVGLSADLLGRCQLPTAAASRRKIEEFLNSSRWVAALGGEYATGSLPQGLEDQQAAQAAALAGEKAVKSVGCDDPRLHVLALAIVKYLDRTASGGGAGANWVKGCVEFYFGQYTEKQCQCIADIGRSVFPDIHQQPFSREYIANITKSNPFLGFAMMAQCRLWNY